MERQRTGRMANREHRGFARSKIVRDVEGTRCRTPRTRRGPRRRRELFGYLRVGGQELPGESGSRIAGAARSAGDARQRGSSDPVGGVDAQVRHASLTRLGSGARNGTSECDGTSEWFNAGLLDRVAGNMLARW